MGYRLLYRADGAEYDSLKHSLVVDEVWQDRSSASVSAKGVTSLEAGMPIQLVCNTLSSVTFGGSVRGWGVRQSRADTTVRHDIDVDDWRVWFNRERVCKTYTSVAIDSIVRDLVTAYPTSFSASGIHSMLSVSGSLTWTPVTVAYHHDATLTDAIDSLVAMAAVPNATYPPVWGVTPDRTVHLVGDSRSYGTTVVVDDTDLNLQTFEITEIGNSISTRAYVWGGSATVVTSLAAGGNSLRTYHNEAFWGVPVLLGGGAPVCSLYVTNGTELIPIVKSNTVSGDWTVGVSSLNILGATHAGVAINAVVRAVLVQTAPDLTIGITSAVTGNGGIFSSYFDYAAQGWPENPLDLNWLANATHVPPGQTLSRLRLTTTNSQVMPGGWLAVSLTAAGSRRGRYPIQRVRISGFARGERAAPIYEVEAGVTPMYRITSLL